MLEDPSSSANFAPSKQSTAPLLSVGVPVYNGAKWIEDALESFLQQSFTNFELIISDNASSDQTEEICRGYAARDPRVRYHRNSTNVGLYRNFDVAFGLARGKYFKWAADSDYCLEGFFEKCVAVLEARPDVVLVYTQAYLLLWGPDGKEVAMEYFDDFNLEDERPSERFSKYLNREKINNVMHGIIRASALRKTSLIRPMPGSDISMVAELSLMGKFVEVRDRLFVRRYDPETSSMLMDASTAAERDVPMGKTLTHRVSLHGHRFITTFRAPISFSEKLRVWFYLLRRLATVRHQVFSRLARIVSPGR